MKQNVQQKGVPFYIIIAILFILFIIIGSIVDSCSKSTKQSSSPSDNSETNIVSEDNDYSVTTYFLKQDTYAGTCKECFDEIFDYCKVDDRNALRRMASEGRMKLLYKGQKVYLLGVGLGYSLIREDGSNQKLWVVREHIEKK